MHESRKKTVSLHNESNKATKQMITNLMLFGGLGLNEIIVIAIIVLLLFGGKKIPELMNGLGKGVKSFKDGLKEADPETKDNAQQEEKKA